MALFNYLLEASVCMGLSYTLYFFLFKRLTFFSANRYYLLFMVAASIIIPALHIKITEPLPAENVHLAIASAHSGVPEAEDLLPATNQALRVNWLLIAGLAYGSICLAMLTKLFYTILKIIKQAKFNGVKLGADCIVHDHHAGNASFFHIIFLSSGNANPAETEQVLIHEKTHARLWHSADNLYIETVKAFFWFNPFIHLIANTIKQVHEYEVDQHLKNIFDPKKYASLLVKLSAAPAISLTNQFSAYSLKARIGMLFKQRSPGYAKWCYLLTLPILLATGYWFAIDKVYGAGLLKKNFVLVLDAGHGGDNAGARGIGGYREKDLNLQLVKQIQLAANQRGIHTILTRTDDRSVDVRDRVNNHADAFISIHMNAVSPGTDHITNGMEVLVSQNALYPQSKKLAVNVKTSLQQLKGINTEHEIAFDDNQPRKSLYILNHNKAPAILVEMGYLTNKSDLDYVLNPQNQHEIAEKLIDAVVAYGNSN